MGQTIDRPVQETYARFEFIPVIGVPISAFIQHLQVREQRFDRTKKVYHLHMYFHRCELRFAAIRQIQSIVEGESQHFALRMGLELEAMQRPCILFEPTMAHP